VYPPTVEVGEPPTVKSSDELKVPVDKEGMELSQRRGVVVHFFFSAVIPWGYTILAELSPKFCSIQQKTGSKLRSQTHFSGPPLQKEVHPEP